MDGAREGSETDIIPCTTRRGERQTKDKLQKGPRAVLAEALREGYQGAVAWRKEALAGEVCVESALGWPWECWERGEIAKLA